MRPSKGKVSLSPIASSRASTRRVPGTVAKRSNDKRPDVKAIIRVILASLDDIKAEDVVTIDLAGKSSYADAIIVSSGRSHRHVASIADRVIDGLKQAGISNLHVEGMKNCDWVLVDAGDVIVHVFRPEVRAFYALEKLWSGSTASNPRGRRAS